MSLLGPNGIPVQQRRGIPDELLQQILSAHETRLAAIGAQQVQLAIMVEFLSEQLEKYIPDWDVDDDEFAAFRERRWNEMREEAQQYAEQAAAQARAQLVDDQRVPVNLTEDGADD